MKEISPSVSNTESRPAAEATGQALFVMWSRRWLPVGMVWVSGMNFSLALVRFHEGDILWQLHGAVAMLSIGMAIFIRAQADELE